MKLSMTNDEINNKTAFRVGARGYLATEENPITIIGEDDTYVWTILDRGGHYYGVLKAPENLSAICITNKPQKK